MKKVSIIYWSNGGNVELIANSIAEGASQEGIEVNIKHVIDAIEEDVLTADAIAFGSPAMVNDSIEEIEMKPFIEGLRNLDIRNKKVLLFGSCGWREENFIHKWEALMEDYGFKVVGKLISHESLKEDEIKLAKELGRNLIK